MNTLDNSNDPSSVTPQAGTTLYYALLYTDAIETKKALDTLRLIDAISGSLVDVSEPQVAEKKIHWWHEELARLAQQTSRHPACIAVQDFLHSKASVSDCLKVLSAASNERYSPIATEAELNEELVSDYGARLRLFQRALGQEQTKQATSINEGEQPIKFQPKPGTTQNNAASGDLSERLNTNEAIALGLGQFQRLQSLNMRLHRGFSVFSNEHYQKFELSPDDLIKRTSSDDLHASANKNNSNTLLASAIADAHSSLSNAMQRLSEPRAGQQISLPVNIICRIRLAQLTLWKKRNPDLVNETITLTPLRKFFIAYRTKRHFEKRN